MIVRKTGLGALLCAASSNLLACGGSTFFSPITEEQFESCLCELQAYATALNQVAGIDVAGAPYICADIECPTPEIPTLNQYGMIIMAAVLGLFAVISLFVMRRGSVVKPGG